MKVLIAANAFKGTLGPAAAAQAAARGFLRAFPGAKVELLPIADGGDGLLEALAPALGGRLVSSRVTGPLGRPLEARWLLAGRTAVIEMAQASGLCRLGKAKPRPLDASTRGVGELMAEARRRGAREIIIGLGGSASNDGGAGCAAAAGFRLLGRGGRAAAPGARGLAGLEAILAGPGARLFKGIRVTGLADVKNPLLGRLGSARVFGPQKGASQAEVAFMEAALRNYARVVRKCLGRGVGRLPGGAAAGGLGAGLSAFFGAELADGAAFVLGRTGFEEKLRAADLLITGEGCFDRQTFYGKAPGAALAAARRLGKPAVVVCGVSLLKGQRELSRLGVAAVIEAGRAGGAARALERAVARDICKALSGLGI